MPGSIEDYAVIGNCETMALVGRDGSIDWLGLPRFDSAACMAALLGDLSHGRWLVGAAEDGARVTRRYRGDTLILETTIETAGGAACVIDFLARRDGVSDVFRLVRGTRGTVSMRTEIVVRFEYGSVIPWLSRQEDGRRFARRRRRSTRLRLSTRWRLFGRTGARRSSPLANGPAPRFDRC
jgi:GH15 family glucan-1,4-alpha-glucosidase